MDDLQLKELIAKVNNGIASDEELATYNVYMNRIAPGDTNWDSRTMGEPEIIKQALWAQLNEVIDQHKKVKIITFWPRLAVAASILLCLSIAGYFTWHKQVNNQYAKNDIAPGGNKAVLTLANGKRIVLTDTKNGQVAKQAGIKITKIANGKLVYAVSDLLHPSVEPSYNTIETPKGGEYEVSLPDGTNVWLNAASSLKYPTSFSTLKERKVQLTGEAYFEVSHDKAHPFLVQTEKEIVTVLGTHFNINAYNDEPSVKTTLLEGSVSVAYGLNKTIIRPGQQAILTDATLKSEYVDTDEVIAWKNGMFQFSDESLESIMRKVSRWYNIDVEYKDKEVKTLPLTGFITHFSNASKVLRMLELTKQVHFKIEGRKIIVMK